MESDRSRLRVSSRRDKNVLRSDVVMGAQLRGCARTRRIVRFQWVDYGVRDLCLNKTVLEKQSRILTM